MFTTIISKTQIDSELAHVQTKSESRTRWVDNVSFTVESVRFDRIKLKGQQITEVMPSLLYHIYALFLLNNITFSIGLSSALVYFSAFCFKNPFNIKSDTNTKLTDGKQHYVGRHKVN